MKNRHDSRFLRCMHQSCRGAAGIVLALVILTGGVFLVEQNNQAYLKTKIDRAENQEDRFELIKLSLYTYKTKNGVFPCPAPIISATMDQTVTHPLFGRVKFGGVITETPTGVADPADEEDADDAFCDAIVAAKEIIDAATTVYGLVTPLTTSAVQASYNASIGYETASQTYLDAANADLASAQAAESAATTAWNAMQTALGIASAAGETPSSELSNLTDAASVVMPALADVSAQLAGIVSAATDTYNAIGSGNEATLHATTISLSFAVFPANTNLQTLTNTADGLVSDAEVAEGCDAEDPDLIDETIADEDTGTIPTDITYVETACAAGATDNGPGWEIINAGNHHVGTLPVRDLGLPDSWGFDNYGSPLFYAVTSSLAANTFTYGRDPATLMIVDRTNADILNGRRAAWVVWSSGADKFNAQVWTRQDCLNNARDTLDAENCDLDGVYRIGGSLTRRADAEEGHYDDTLMYGFKK